MPSVVPRIKFSRHFFSLMEVMVAAAVLALAVAATMGILGTARSTLMRAERRWENAHALSNAAELFLLGGPHPSWPDLPLLPEGLSATCAVRAAEDLEPDAQQEMHSWSLAELEIRLQTDDGEEHASTVVQKVWQTEDIP